MTQTAADRAPGTTTLEPPTRPQRTGPSWARSFVGGLVLWSAAVLVSFVSYAFGHADGGRRTVRVTIGQHPG
jgi:hypothetical protein